MTKGILSRKRFTTDINTMSTMETSEQSHTDYGVA